MSLNKLSKLLRFSNHIGLMNIRRLETGVDNVQGKLFANILGLEQSIARQYVNEHHLVELDTIRLGNTLEFLQTNKYRTDEVLKRPKLFQLCANRSWDQYYQYLKECGCLDVKLDYLLSFRKLSSSSITSLKKQGVLPKKVAVAKSLIKHLTPLPNEFYIDDLLDDNLLLNHVHKTIVHRFLAYRLEATDEELQKLTRIHTAAYNKSLVYLSENINMALSLGYSKGKLMRNGYILTNHPKNTKEVLETVPNLAGTDMKRQMFLYPKLMGTSLQSILRIYDILKKENISDDMIAKSMNIFTLSPTSVEKRLNELKSTPETRLLMNNPTVLSMIVHFHRAKSRLNFLQQIKLKCISCILLRTNYENYFNDYVDMEEDTNNMNETIRLLRALLKTDAPDLETNWRKHPLHLRVPFVQIEDTFLYLKSLAFTNTSIVKCVQILLYPKEVIAEAMEKLKADKSVSNRKPKMGKVRTLNILLYLMEKEHGFRILKNKK